MGQYISKDALVAEIEKLRSKVDISTRHGQGLADAYFAVKTFIDTFEAKELDLEKEIQTQWKGCSPIDEGMGCEFANISVEQFDSIAKHFFELGMQASNPLTWKDIACINGITDTLLRECGNKISYDTEEDFSKEVLKRFKAQKGEEV